jgi:hypothetical protein
MTFAPLLAARTVATGGMLIGIGSPYRRVGLLHQKHRDYYGVNDDDVRVGARFDEAFIYAGLIGSKRTTAL